MLIVKSGNTLFTGNWQCFKLNDRLFVPYTTKNLVSVNIVCHDNQVCMEFNDQMVKLKYRGSDETLLERHEDGLYTLPVRVNKQPQVFLSEGVTTQLWYHKR